MSEIIQEESFMACLPELQELFPLHWKELAMNQDKVPLAPAYDKYQAMEEAGGLVLTTLRVDGKVKGYFIGFISPGLHYTTCLDCAMDIFWVHPDIRAEGMPGLRLFRATEQILKARGVQRWFAAAKIKAPVTPLFKRMGFEPIETYHSKWIGE